MGPTNVALVKLFRADQELRDAQVRLDEAARNVRVQERRVVELRDKLAAGQKMLREQQTKASHFELDLKSRDVHIEKLRTQQQATKNNKEYQAFLVEINTAKVDKSKVEEETMKVMEVVEKGQAEQAALAAHVEAEQAKLKGMLAQVGDTLKNFQAEVDSLTPLRDEAAAALPPKARDAFRRLAEHHEGEAMSAVSKPDRRREEYLCTACNMDLVADVYNKLHSRDELVFCPSCRRILYIPEDLPVEAAINVRAPRPTSGSTRAKSSASAAGKASPGAAAAPVQIEKRAKGKIGALLTAAQGESVQAAVVSDQNPVECEVFLNGELAGIYKAKDPGHLERIIRYRMGEAKMEGTLQVVPGRNEGDTPPTAESTTAPTAADVPAGTATGDAASEVDLREEARSPQEAGATADQTSEGSIPQG